MLLTISILSHDKSEAAQGTRTFCLCTLFRKQHAGESIAEYVAVLCKAAEYCSYDESLSVLSEDSTVLSIHCFQQL